MRMLKYAVLAVAVAAPVLAAQTATRNAEQTAAQTAAKKTEPAPQAIVVYKTATCGCCGKWVEHLKAAGFAPTVNTVQTMDEAPMRKRIPTTLRSCHTATLEGYLVEGHVPADVIRKLLKEKPRVEGIAVPGMPAGSPGMESSHPELYDIVAFDATGKTSVFAKK